MFHRRVIVVAAGLAAGLVLPTGAPGKSVGGCPHGASEKWELVTVESLGISPELASGIASLDGNGDGLTCIKPMPHVGGFTFRDNTV